MDQFFSLSVQKRKLLNKIFYSENLLLYRMYSLYLSTREYIYPNLNPHIDHSRKLIFIHNPKAAGNTIHQMLGFPHNKFGSHFTPTFLVSPKIWEQYFSIVSIRHPLDKLISAYFHLTDPSYKGYYYKIFPQIHNFSLREFFETFKTSPFFTTPQYRYIRHHFSTKPVDFIIRYEHLENDLRSLKNSYGIKINLRNIPVSNKGTYSGKRKAELLKDSKLIKEIIYYHRHDFSVFGYDY